MTESIYPASESLLPHVARLENFGHSVAYPSYVFHPTSNDQIAGAFAFAMKQNLTVGLRGASRSYGDAAINSGGVVLDFSNMNRVLDWDPEKGIIQVEPGVTIQQLWQHTLPTGWWPPVVPGTMKPTLAGCLAMNVHGKNNYQAGPIGEHILSFTALLPSGDEIACSPGENTDLFYAMIGGIGMLGVFTSITLKMKKIQSGNLRIHAWSAPELKTMIDEIEENAALHDYVVGWVDCTASKASLGRGQIHSADYLNQEHDPEAGESLNVEYQVLPSKMFGLLPKAMLPYLMKPFMHNLGVRVVNLSRHIANTTIGNNKTYKQSHVAFNFLLDYIPGWELAYGSGGLIQYQCFITKDKALPVFQEMIRISQSKKLPSFLGVLKRHRPDRFLLSHAVDGFSLAQDFRVTRANRVDIVALCQIFDRLVLEAGGRFYFAKDITLRRSTVAAYLGDNSQSEFIQLKERCDPGRVLQSNLFRRCFPS